MNLFRKNSQNSVLPQFGYAAGESSELNLMLYLRAVWALDVLPGYELIVQPLEKESSPDIADLEIVWENQWASVVGQLLSATDPSKRIVGWNEDERGRIGWSLDLFYKWVAESDERISKRYRADLFDLPEAKNHILLDQAHTRGLRRTVVIPLKGQFFLNGREVLLVSENARSDQETYGEALSQWRPSFSTEFKPHIITS